MCRVRSGSERHFLRTNKMRPTDGAEAAHCSPFLKDSHLLRVRIGSDMQVPPREAAVLVAGVNEQA